MLRQTVLILSHEMMLQTLNDSLPFIIFIVLTILTIIVIIILLYESFTDDEGSNTDTNRIISKLIEEIDFSAGPDKEGGMGKVWIVNDPNDKTNHQKKLAVKFYKKDNQLAKLAEHRVIREIENLRVLKHKNIVTYREHGFINHPKPNDKTDYLIMDYFDGYTIKDLLSKHSNKKFPHLAIIEIGRQIIDALEYSHKQEIVHRDLTLTNVLVDQSGNVCIIDFGNSTKVGSEVTMVFKAKHGTLNFLPPENLKLGDASKKVDLYQLAVLMYAMYGGELFKGDLHRNGREKADQFIKDNIKRNLIRIPAKISDILLACLEGKYNNTCNLREALGLPLADDLAQMVQNIANPSTFQRPKLAQSRSDEKVTDLIQNDEELTRTAQNKDPEDEG